MHKCDSHRKGSILLSGHLINHCPPSRKKKDKQTGDKEGSRQTRDKGRLRLRDLIKRVSQIL